MAPAKQAEDPRSAVDSHALGLKPRDMARRKGLLEKMVERTSSLVGLTSRGIEEQGGLQVDRGLAACIQEGGRSFVEQIDAVP